MLTDELNVQGNVPHPGSAPAFSHVKLIALA